MAYLEEFRGVQDVTLYVHACLDPSNECGRGPVLSAMTRTLQHFTGKLYDLMQGSPDLPHIHVVGHRLSQREVINMYASVNAFIHTGPSSSIHSLEALSMRVPVVALADPRHISPCMDPSNTFFTTAINATGLATGLPTPIEAVSPTLQSAWSMGEQVFSPSLVAAASSRLRDAYGSSHSDLAAMGRSGRTAITDRCSIAAVASQMQLRLLEIQANMTGLVRPVRSLDIYNNNFQNIHLCGNVVKSDQMAASRQKRRKQGEPLSLAIISSWPPRKCGIAAFAANTVTALLKEHAEIHVSVFAMTIPEDLGVVGHDPLVNMTMRRANFGDYIHAVQEINAGDYHAVIIEHEFGIFGGDSGIFAVCLARMIHVPVLAVLHNLCDEISDAHTMSLSIWRQVWMHLLSCLQHPRQQSGPTMASLARAYM